ncbi:hypothetical protein BH18ACT1_BH18ACT1_05510 [soil metagenome]
MVLTVTLAVGLAACGDDSGGGDDNAATSTPPPTEETEPLPDDLCAVLAEAGAVGASGLPLGPGAPTTDDGRAVCAYRATDSGGIGVTVGVDASTPFEQKAERSREAVGEAGEAVADLGDEAIFLFTTADGPEGLGGMLVGKGPRTIDVTIQGVADAAEARRASAALAEGVLEVL